MAKLLTLVPCNLARAARQYAPLDEVAQKQKPRILIIACHWIGDTLWAAQVLPVLREFWPEAHIAVVTKTFCRPIWSGRLAADEIIIGGPVVSDRRRECVNWQSLGKLANRLAGQNWDIAIDLTGNRYSAILCHQIHARHTIGFDGGELGALYATCVVDVEKSGVHLSQRPFRVIQPILKRFAYTGEVLPPKPSINNEDLFGKYGLDASRPIVVIAAGAGWREKCWGTQNFAAGAKILLGKWWQVVLAGTPKELELSRDILNRVGDEYHSSVHLVHEETLDAILGILAGASAFIGNDSGLGHIAAAIGIPTVTIFTGATSPEECGPLGRQTRCFIADSSEASPEAVALHVLRVSQK